MPAFPRHLVRSAALTLLLIASWLSGCTLLGLTDPTPRYVGTETLERIDKGATGQDWILAVFGQPTAKAKLADNLTEIWKYPYSYADDRGNRMRLLSAEEGQSASRVIFVQLSHGIVTDWWRD